MPSLLLKPKAGDQNVMHLNSKPERVSIISKPVREAALKYDFVRSTVLCFGFAPPRYIIVIASGRIIL